MVQNLPLLAIILFLLLSCGQEDTTLGIEFPTQENIRWNHAIFAYSDEDTLQIGTVESINRSTGRFQGREGVTEIERAIRLDSMQNTVRPIDVRSTYIQVKNGRIELYADSYFDVFDRLLNGVVLDTLTRNGDGADYQQFSFIEPGWITYLNLENEPDLPSVVYPSYRVFLDFYYREVHLQGEVSVFAQTQFADFDVIDTPLKKNVVTYRYKTTHYFDFSLTRNGIQLPPFRTTVVMIEWVHKTAGIIQRSREPFKLYIPQVPSRDPIVFIRGEYWKLTGLEGISL